MNVAIALAHAALDSATYENYYGEDCQLCWQVVRVR